MHRTPLLFLVLLVLAACAKDSDQIVRAGAEVLYERAQSSMESGNFRNAIAYYEQLEARFPFSNYARQAQLDLIYAYYKNGEQEAAIDAAEQFMRENPTHPRVDYALYMQGLVWFDEEPNVIDRLLRVDPTERPPSGTMRAYSAFEQLLQRFPQSEYAPDARERMVFLRNRLADYETHVARFYLDRNAYVAALNRAKYCIERFPGAPQNVEALEIMVRAYERLGMEELAADTRRVLEESYAAYR